MATYRVFCSEGQVPNLPQDVQITETYPAFTVVSATEGALSSVQQSFPVEHLQQLDSDPQMRIAVAARATRGAVPQVAGVAAGGKPTTHQGRERVVRFDAPIRASWQQQLAEAGAIVLRPLSGSALVVSVPDETVLTTIRRIEHVAKIDPYVPMFRIRPETLVPSGGPVTEEAVATARRQTVSTPTPASKNRGLAVPGVVIASFFTRQDRDRAARSLARRGVRVLSRVRQTDLALELAPGGTTTNALAVIAERPGLRLIEEKPVRTVFNDVARRVIGAGVVDPVPGGHALTGQGEFVAVADTGLDTGIVSTLHLDFTGRVRKLRSFPIAPSLASLVLNPGGDDGPSDRYSGHGTHVSGSILGDGSQAVALGLQPIMGMAPQAELIFQAIEQTPQWTLQAQLSFYQQGQQPPVSGLFGIPDNLTDLFDAAYAEGARIHSNSWGGGTPGAYDTQCEDLDRFMWTHKDFLVLVAAGNAGKNSSAASQSIDPTSVDSPGTAKNCLTVGASENDRKGQFTDTYGQWWPSDFPNPPFNADPMVDSIDDIVAFSSRGPCTTGRRKPDVIAPGTFILSTRSSQIASNNFAWASYPPAKQFYMYMGGTSMATPLVAGSVALVRQYLRSERGFANPSAALLKAALIHCAQYIHYRWPNAASAQWADDEQGWGRVTLSRVLAPIAPTNVLFIDEAQGLITGQERQFSADVADGSVPFRVTLVYTDYPGEDLVNNLNLVMYDPNGAYYLGNDFSNSRSPDSTNNVEGIVIETPAVGTWTVKVVASEVLQGQQEFALVLSGGGISLT